MKVQSLAKTIGDYGCLFFCYLYCSGLYSTPADAISKAIDFMRQGLLDNECMVLNPEAILYQLTGRRFEVIKKPITSIELIEKPTPVKFAHNGFGHWVVVEHGKIVFNSLDKSVCVEKGKPVDARVIYGK